MILVGIIPNRPQKNFSYLGIVMDLLTFKVETEGMEACEELRREDPSEGEKKILNIYCFYDAERRYFRIRTESEGYELSFDRTDGNYIENFEV